MLPIYFDMDNTLSRTSDYQKQEVEKELIKIGDLEGLEEFKFWCMSGEPRYKYPSPYNTMLSDIIKNKDYILNLKPTPLFNYFFLTPGNKPKMSVFNILTHRGEDIEAKNLTSQWIHSFKPCVDIKEIHSISHKKNPSKIEYLSKLHPDGNFIIVDDNPMFYTDKEHPYHKQIRIFDMYDKYEIAYKNQIKVTYYKGFFDLHL